MKSCTGLSILCLLLSLFWTSVGRAEEATTTRSRYCDAFMEQATYTPHFKSLSSAFRLDPDYGIRVNEKTLKELNLVYFKGERSHRLETNPLSPGKLYGVKDGLQMEDLGREPRVIEITEDYLANYSENFIATPKPINAAKPQAYIFRYRFSFRNGRCIPLEVTRIEAGSESRIYDFDRCYELGQPGVLKNKRDELLDCHAIPLFSELAADRKFDRGSGRSKARDTDRIAN